MILVYRNVDSPDGDFGLVKQEGDERFVVLTPEEYRDLRERVEAAEGALRFYADPKTYDATDFVDVGVGNMPIPGTSLADYDGGERARLALRSSGTREGGVAP